MNFKSFGLVLVGVAMLYAEEPAVEDLGVVSPKIGLFLEKETTRSDWSHFRVEFLPKTPPTNQVTLIFTNQVISLSNLVALPSGPIIMGLVSVCSDGTESAIKLYQFEIRRAEPPVPSVHRIVIFDGGAKPTNSLSHELKRRRERPAAPPPVPGKTNSATHPMPNGIGETYAQYLDKMVEFHAEHIRKRRNQ